MKKIEGIIPMNRTTPNIFIFLITILLSSTMVGCATAPRYPAVPFAVHKTGATMVQDVKLVHDRTYEFSLKLYHNRGKDADRVSKLAGSGARRKDETGKWFQIDDGIPIYVELEIIGLDEAVKGFHFKEKLYVDELIAGGLERVKNINNEAIDKYYFRKIIKRIRLKPGFYQITLKSLRDIPELIGTSVAFQFSWDWNSRPFDE